MSGKAPGSPRRPSSRHPRSSELENPFRKKRRPSSFRVTIGRFPWRGFEGGVRGACAQCIPYKLALYLQVQALGTSFKNVLWSAEAAHLYCKDFTISQGVRTCYGAKFYTPPPPHPWKYPSRGGGRIKEGGRIKSCRGGLQNIHPPPLSLKKVFWPKWVGGGGGVYNFSLDMWCSCARYPYLQIRKRQETRKSRVREVNRDRSRIILSFWMHQNTVKHYVAPIGAFFCTSMSPINGHERLLPAINGY